MESAPLTLNVVTPNRKVVENLEVTEVRLPGALGEMTLLPHHQDLVSLLDTGVVLFKDAQGQVTEAAMSWGYLEVKENVVNLLADTLEREDEIDLARAQRALEKAEEMLNKQDLTDANFKKYQSKLHRAVTRIQVVKR